MRSLAAQFQTFVTLLRMQVKLGAAPWEFAAWRLIGKHVAVEAHLKYAGRSFTIRVDSSSDIAAIREVFLDEEYAHKHIADARHLFDVGGNIGMASIYLACLYPEADVHAFEPDPILNEKLRYNVRAFPNVKAYALALSDEVGEKTFYTHPRLPLSGSLLQRTRNTVELQVRTSTISAVVAELGIDRIDLLKFDIEGGEKMLFSSAQDRAPVQRAIGEVHLDLLGMNSKEFARLFIGFSTRYIRQTQDQRYLFYAEKITEGTV